MYILQYLCPYYYLYVHTTITVYILLSLWMNLPSNTSIFRDGVGAGQLQEVLDLEVASIQRALKSQEILEEIPEGIRLTFIVVSKRINTRYRTLSYFAREVSLYG